MSVPAAAAPFKNPREFTGFSTTAARIFMDFHGLPSGYHGISIGYLYPMGTMGTPRVHRKSHGEVATLCLSYVML